MPAAGSRSAKSVYVHGVRTLGKALRKAGLLTTDVPDVTQRGRHWAHSLFCVHDVQALTSLGVPWWTYSSIDALTTWVEERDEPVTAFEFGSGASTFWLADHAQHVTSIEHDEVFGELMTEQLEDRPNVTLRVVPGVASTRPQVPSRKPGWTSLDFSSYVETLDESPGQFDLVVIDGRARSECLRRAVPRLAPGGLIVFDNSRRQRYRGAIDASGLQERKYAGLTPCLPYPEQTSLLTQR